MPIATIVTRLLETTAPSAHLQRLAASLRAPGWEGRRLRVTLARVPDLDPQIRAELRADTDHHVRQAAWSRGDAAQDEVLHALSEERHPDVLTVLVASVRDVDDLERVLRARVADVGASVGLLAAAAAARRWDLPGDLLVAALRAHGSRGQAEMLLHMARSGRDLSAVAASTSEISALYRLAACASTGTPDAVLTEHLVDILSTRSLYKRSDSAAATGDLLRLLARRVPHIEAQAEHLRTSSRSGQATQAPAALEMSWQRWNELAPNQAAALRAALDQATTPAAVEELWLAVSEQEKPAAAEMVTQHPLCPAAVYRSAIAVLTGPRPDHDRFTSLLWMRQDENLFKARLLTEPLSLLHHLDAAHDCPWSAPETDLLGWALDVMVLNPPDAVSQWFDLLAYPGFPQQRLGEVPAIVIASAMEETAKRPGLAWVTTEIAALFGALTDGDPHLQALVLSETVTAEADLPGLLRAVRHSMA